MQVTPVADGGLWLEVGSVVEKVLSLAPWKTARRHRYVSARSKRARAVFERRDPTPLHLHMCEYHLRERLLETLAPVRLADPAHEIFAAAETIRSHLATYGGYPLAQRGHDDPAGMPSLFVP